MAEKSRDAKTLGEKLEAARSDAAQHKGDYSREGELPGVMSSHPASRMTLPMIVALLVLAGAPIAFVAAFPWLLQQPREVIFLFSGIAVTLIIVAMFSLFVLSDRGTDEWHRSAARFSSQWGHRAGSGLVLLLLLPLSGWIGSWAPDRYQEFVQLGFVFGFLAVIIAQVVCVALLHVGWTFWMSRSPREPHEKQD